MELHLSSPELHSLQVFACKYETRSRQLRWPIHKERCIQQGNFLQILRKEQNLLSVGRNGRQLDIALQESERTGRGYVKLKHLENLHLHLEHLRTSELVLTHL